MKSTIMLRESLFLIYIHPHISLHLLKFLGGNRTVLLSSFLMTLPSFTHFQESPDGPTHCTNASLFDGTPLLLDLPNSVLPPTHGRKHSSLAPSLLHLLPATASQRAPKAAGQSRNAEILPLVSRALFCF